MTLLNLTSTRGLFGLILDPDNVEREPLDGTPYMYEVFVLSWRRLDAAVAPLDLVKPEAPPGLTKPSSTRTCTVQCF